MNFSDQQTHFTFYDGVEVKKIVFQTIDGQKYGQIELDYDYLGYLEEERWRDLPSARIIRRFKYKFDIIFIDPPFKEEKINYLINLIKKKNILNKQGILIIHRHKKDKTEITKKVKILDTRNYGNSKVYFVS